MKHKLFTLFVLLALMLAFLPAQPARAATWTVDTLTDEIDSSCSDGDCSLRDAVNLSGSGDTIQFSVSGTMTIGTQIPLTKNLTIMGPGAANLTLSGAGTNRILAVAVGKTVSIFGLTFTNGNMGWGGAIFSEGNLNVHNCIFSANQATAGTGGGAIYNTSTGSLYVGQSQFNANSSAGFGGAIHSDGDAIVDDTIFYMNNASNGGAIYMTGDVYVQMASFLDNYTTAYGGGAISAQTAAGLDVYASMFSDNSAVQQGGGIYSLNTPVTIANSTLETNTATQKGGGIYNRGGALTVTNATFSGNGAAVSSGAGIHNESGGTLNYINTILANSVTTVDCVNTATLGTNTNNLAETGNCAAALTADPVLGPLTNNGGPTETMALQPGSPAIDAGNDASCPVEDQRGSYRWTLTHCDIGSFELDNSVPTDIALSSSSVAENLPAGATVGALTTTDSDTNNAHIYTFTCTTPGADDGSFQVGGAGGDELQTAAVFDYETKNTFNICLRTDDGHSGVFDEPFTIHLTDILEGTSTFQSIGADDGWILETGENTTKGGTTDSAATTLRLGDDSAKKQYRSILSFATGAALPDNAVITKVTLKVKKQGITGGGNPVTAFQGFMVDIRKGLFGTAALQTTDFQGAASQTFGPFTTALSGAWYTIDLTAGTARINKLATSGGLTQIRLRFQLDDDGNTSANYLSLYSGNAGTANRPQLIIEYYVP